MDEPRFCLRFLYHFGDDVGLEPKAQQATTKQIRQLTLAVRLSHISRNDENCKLRVILAYQRCAGDARGFESVKTVALHDGQTPVSGCTPTVCSRVFPVCRCVSPRAPLLDPKPKGFCRAAILRVTTAYNVCPRG